MVKMRMNQSIQGYPNLRYCKQTIPNLWESKEKERLKQAEKRLQRRLNREAHGMQGEISTDWRSTLQPSKMTFGQRRTMESVNAFLGGKRRVGLSLLAHKLPTLILVFYWYPQKDRTSHWNIVVMGWCLGCTRETRREYCTREKTTQLCTRMLMLMINYDGVDGDDDDYDYDDDDGDDDDDDALMVMMMMMVMVMVMVMVMAMVMVMVMVVMMMMKMVVMVMVSRRKWSSGCPYNEVKQRVWLVDPSLFFPSPAPHPMVSRRKWSSGCVPIMKLTSSGYFPIMKLTSPTPPPKAVCVKLSQLCVYKWVRILCAHLSQFCVRKWGAYLVRWLKWK